MHAQTSCKSHWLLTTQRALLLPVFLVMIWLLIPTGGAAAQAPEWQTHAPLTNTVTAPLTTTVSITYDQAMSATTVTSRTFGVYGMQSGLVTGTHSVIHGNTLIVTPTRAFYQGELVYAIATTQTQSLTGSAPLSATQWQFNAGEANNRCFGTFIKDNAASANLIGVDDSSVAWGDYDNDGDLDILLTGQDSGGSLTAVIYENQAGVFVTDTAASANLTSVDSGSVAWGDYDNDGDLDILLTGKDSGYTPHAVVYENQAGIFVEDIAASANLTGVDDSSVAWGDYDNDGDLDILLTGKDSGYTPHAVVYENQVGVFVTDTAASTNLIGVDDSSVAWGDYDDDGDLDILLTGRDSSGGRHAVVYENQAGVFVADTSASANLTSVDSGSVAWGDYDNDGDLDILLTGTNSDYVNRTVIYENQAGIFVEDATASANLTGVDDSSVAWGDYDNDGDLDVLLTGKDSGYIPHAVVYENQASVFSEDASASVNLIDVQNSSVAWGDYDNDGDLDILLTGRDSSGYTHHAVVYRNHDCGLALESAYPARNTHTALLTTTVSVTYDQPMSATTVTSRTLAVYGMQSGLVTETHDVINGNTLLVTPNRAFHQGELVYAIATTQTADITGTQSLNATQWQFNAGVVCNRCVGAFITDTVASANLTGVYFSSVAWGDYDNDGDLDILLTGRDSSGGRHAVVYENQASVFITDPVASVNLTSVDSGSVAWGDYDNDGDLDILLTGKCSSGGTTALVYENQAGVFVTDTVASVNLTSVDSGSVAWGDYDNDGDLDILLTGGASSSSVARIYENQAGSFTPNTSYYLTGVTHGSVAWGDYDDDGDLDILLTGIDYAGVPIARIYENRAGVFSGDVAASVNLTGVRNSSVAWGDYDNDGDLDILLTGSDINWVPNKYALVYENRDGIFTEDSAASVNLTGVDYGSVAWGDYDNDGDLDILLTGRDSSGGRHALVYRNDDCPADLFITKTVAPSNAAPGEPVTYTLAFSNAGGLATGVVISDAIPVSVTGSSVSSSAIITARGGTPYAWDVTDLAFRAGGVITITGVLSDVLPAGALNNTAIITTAVDGDPDNNRSDAALTVLNVAPVADDDAYSTDEGNTLFVAAPGVLAGDTDANGDALTAVLNSVVATGTLTLGSNGSFIYTPPPDFCGVVTFRYHARDTAGGGGNLSNVALVTIAVCADVPTANYDGYTTDEDVTLSVPAPGVLANDSDPNRTPLTATLESAPRNGSLVLHADGSFIYTPTLHYHGPDSFTYRATNGTDTSNPATVAITVTDVNDPPVATDDVFIVPKDSSGNVLDVLDGDTDADGDTLIISAVSTPDSGGTVVNGGLRIVYTPPSGFAGDEVFTYTISDNNGANATAWVTITVSSSVSRWPVADDDTFTVGENSSGNVLDVLDGDTDADGDTLSIAAVGMPDSDGMAVNGGTVVVYTPQTGFVGNEVFTYTISDGNGGYDTALVTVTVSTGVNSPPVAVAGNDQRVAIGEMVTLDGSGSYDPDGHGPLTYSWAQMGGPGITFTSNLSITTFIAPSSAAVLTFTLTVTDTPAGTLHLPSMPDMVVITVTEADFYIYLPLALRNY